MSTPKKSKKIKSKKQAQHSTKPKKEQVKTRGRKITNIIYPDMPIHYAKAGFPRRGKKVYQTNEKIHIHTTYKHEGDSSFYSASFFGGVIHAQLIPINKLVDFLIEQDAIDQDEGQWYDKITLKENDRDMWGQAGGFSFMHDSSEEFLLYLEQYKRHGSLIGQGQTFEYIQVCFIQLAN